MKPIQYSKHALEQMAERGADADKVTETIRTGEIVPAKRGRQGFRKNFQYDRTWGGKSFSIQQVLAIVAEEPEAMVVVTVYSFYF